MPRSTKRIGEVSVERERRDRDARFNFNSGHQSTVCAGKNLHTTVADSN